MTRRPERVVIGGGKPGTRGGAAFDSPSDEVPVGEEEEEDEDADSEESSLLDVPDPSGGGMLRSQGTMKGAAGAAGVGRVTDESGTDVGKMSLCVADLE